MVLHATVEEQKMDTSLTPKAEGPLILLYKVVEAVALNPNLASASGFSSQRALLDSLLALMSLFSAGLSGQTGSMEAPPSLFLVPLVPETRIRAWEHFWHPLAGGFLLLFALTRTSLPPLAVYKAHHLGRCLLMVRPPRPVYPCLFLLFRP